MAQWPARALLGLVGRRPTSQEADDFVTTVAAVLAHDTRERLGALRIPTLVVGGALDPFFPAGVLHETAASVPGAVLRVMAGSGHGVPKQR